VASGVTGGSGAGELPRVAIRSSVADGEELGLLHLRNSEAFGQVAKWDVYRRESPWTGSSYLHTTRSLFESHITNRPFGSGLAFIGIHFPFGPRAKTMSAPHFRHLFMSLFSGVHD